MISRVVVPAETGVATDEVAVATAADADNPYRIRIAKQGTVLTVPCFYMQILIVPNFYQVN
jgi:hypothetical protein